MAQTRSKSKRHGLKTFYGSNGYLSHLLEYKDGKPIGKALSFLDNGMLSDVDTYSHDENTFDFGIALDLHGRIQEQRVSVDGWTWQCINWYPNSEKQAEWIQRGRNISKYKEWDQAGNLILIGCSKEHSQRVT